MKSVEKLLKSTEKNCQLVHLAFLRTPKKWHQLIKCIPKGKKTKSTSQPESTNLQFLATYFAFYSHKKCQVSKWNNKNTSIHLLQLVCSAPRTML